MIPLTRKELYILVGVTLAQLAEMPNCHKRAPGWCGDQELMNTLRNNNKTGGVCYTAVGVSVVAVVRRPLNPKVEYSSV
jgi:hypothetical protein